MKSVTGNGVVKTAGERKLAVVLDKDDKPTAESEGYFTYSANQAESLEEVFTYYSNPENALTVTNDADEKVKLSAEDSVLQIINKEWERAAKANQYGKTVAKFKPAEDPKAAFEKIVRTFMSMGLPEDMAIKHANAAVAENAARAAAETESAGA